MRRRRQLLSFLLVACVAAAVASVAGVSGTDTTGSNGFALLLDRDQAADGAQSGASGKGRIINGAKAAPLTNASRLRSTSFMLKYTGYSYGFCGGTFVTKRRVVTAAHCVRSGATPTPANQLYVTSGVNDIKPIIDAIRAGKRPAEIAALIPVRAVAVHPAYNDDTFANDAAVLETTRDATLTPTPLVGPNERGAWGGGAGRDVVGEGGPLVAGWGDTSYGSASTTSDQLLEARIPITSDAACTELLGTRVDLTNMLCAGVLDTDGVHETSNGVDSCQGDSGGPLFAPVDDGSMRLVGIVSFGFDCAADSPGVYTRVDAVRGWIESVTGPASGTGAMAAPVVGGGGPAASELAITAPVSDVVLPVRGATTVTWTQPIKYRVKEVVITGDDGTKIPVPVDAGARSVLVGHGTLPAGRSSICVEAVAAATGSFEDSECVYVTKGQQFTARVSSALYRRGKLVLSGSVASSARTVKVSVKVSGGGRAVKTRVMTYSLPVYPGAKRFTVSVPWRGRLPRSVVTVTSVTGGGESKSFRSVLR